jgi:Cu/Ag efflux pump CusA
MNTTNKTKTKENRNKKTKTNKTKINIIGGGVMNSVAAKTVGKDVANLKKAGTAVVDTAKAVPGAVKSAFYYFKNMQNPIVYAYEVIERNVFGWNTD